MAEEEKKGGGFSLPSTGLLALTFAVFGLILSGPSQLIDERPLSQMESDLDNGRIQDVDARMWQDPLGAVLRDGKEHGAGGKGASEGNAADHSPQKTIDRAFEDNAEVKSALVLAVMIPGGPYPEEEERRRRERYAVLSALATQHYAPEETEHIGYFVARGACRGKEADCATDNIRVPFELFSNTGQESGSGSQGVVVLWLEDGAFDQKVQNRMNAILDQIHLDRLHPQYAVIGPNRSDQYKALLQEKQAPARKLTFYAAGATVEDRYLGAGPGPRNVFRTVGNDRDISRALVTELQLRQIDPRYDHVLLISEWDSLYGRSLPDTFARAYGGDSAECQPLALAAQGAPGSHVYCVNYMRGIDGLLPKETEKSEQKEDATKQDAMLANNNIDRPSGNNQKDYLRRLVDQVRQLDQAIADSQLPSPVKNNGITAIGVLGSDVYDKLMILQALRPYFPGKLFFTTDLDAAFFTPREQPYTHNVIIGSSYGLSLAPELQMSIPPFRDSYQTAAFLSAKLAIANWTHGKADTDIGAKVSRFLNEPRIFEIGREGPVDLSAGRSANPAGCGENILDCEHVHPDPEAGAGAPGMSYTSLLQVLSFVFGLLLLYRMSWKSRGLFEKSEDWLRGKSPTTLLGELASMLPILAAGTIVVGGLYWFVMRVGKDEPFYWLDGVSIWPSNLLQLAALLLAAWSFVKIRSMLRRSGEEIEKEFLESPVGKAAEPGASGSITALSVHKWKETPEADGKINVQSLWREYLAFGEHRSLRALLNTAFFVLFGFAAVMLSGGLPVPSRGNAFYSDVILELSCVFAVVFLIMWVVDAARLVSRLIAHIAQEQQTDWPCIESAKWGWPGADGAHVACWIDIQFVAHYTKAMEKFIWFPIPPMLLLGVARSSVFDNWTFSAGLFAAIAILLAYLFSTAFLLQHGAKEMRAKAVRRLDGKLKELRGASSADEKKIAQLETMIGKIKANDEGAFTPFMRQPMVQALLALLSGSGGVAMLLEHPFY